MKPDRIPLSALARELRPHGVHLTYYQLWQLASAGVLPEIERSATGRWTLRPESLPKCARALRERFARERAGE